jgi:hypothetical protein
MEERNSKLETEAAALLLWLESQSSRAADLQPQQPARGKRSGARGKCFTFHMCLPWLWPLTFAEILTIQCFTGLRSMCICQETGGTR